MGESLQELLLRIFNTEDNTEITVKVTKYLKKEIKALEGLSEVIKKIGARKLLELYGKKKEKE